MKAMNTKEKPSSLSQNVMKTHLKNDRANYVLETELKNIDRQRCRQNYARYKSIQAVQMVLSNVKKVRTKFSVGPERRVFLLKNGFKIQTRDFEIDDYLQIMDEVIYKDKQRVVRDRLPPKWTNTKSDSRPKMPLLRLPDFIKEQENAKKNQEVQLEKTNLINNEAKRPYTAPSATRLANSQKVRVIKPPVNGRKMYKIQFEQAGLPNGSQKPEEVDRNDAALVEKYRQKVTGKLTISASPLQNTTVNKYRKQRPNTTPSVMNRTRTTISSVNMDHSTAMSSIQRKDIAASQESCKETKKYSTVVKKNTNYKVPTSPPGSRVPRKISVIHININGRSAKAFIPKF